MSRKALRLVSLLCGREITRLHDMTPVEIEACLNAWAETKPNLTKQK